MVSGLYGYIKVEAIEAMKFSFTGSDVFQAGSINVEEFINSTEN